VFQSAFVTLTHTQHRTSPLSRDHETPVRAYGIRPLQPVRTTDQNRMLLLTAIVVCATTLGCIAMIQASGSQKPIQQDQIPPLQTARKDL